MATKVEEWLASLTPDERLELAQRVAPAGERDEYKESILQEAMQLWQRQYGPIVGNVAAHTAMSKLTEGLPAKAADMLREQFKDKPADHILALANDPVYSGLFRGAAEAHVAKEDADAEAAKVAANAEAGLTPEGKPNVMANADTESFRKDVGTIIVDGKPLEWTDEEVKEIVSKAGQSDETGRVVI